jgi:hypothetical protein
MRAKRGSGSANGQVTPFSGHAHVEEANGLNHLVQRLHCYGANISASACLLFDRSGLNQYHFSPN